MREQRKFIADPEGRSLQIYVWEPDDSGRVGGIVQILHGMAEHAGRYRHVAERLTVSGFAVYAADHRGHGGSDGRFPGDIGENGFSWMVHNAQQVAELALREHAAALTDRRVQLIGHSMGSFVAQMAAFKYPQTYKTLLLTGPSYKKGPLLSIGERLARLEHAIRPAGRPSRMLHALTFGAYNRSFRPTRTAYDWLSRDETVVDKYVGDEMCGRMFCAQFYLELFRGLRRLYDPELWTNLDNTMPILIMAGERDPVGAAGKEVAALAAEYRSSGAEQLEVITYPGMRHEIFNELHRERVIEDAVKWLRRFTMT